MDRYDKKKLQALYIYEQTATLLGIYCLALWSLWVYLPGPSFLKMLLTLIIGYNGYNIGKHFIYVRWVLWKQQTKFA